MVLEPRFFIAHAHSSTTLPLPLSHQIKASPVMFSKKISFLIFSPNLGDYVVTKGENDDFQWNNNTTNPTTTYRSGDY